MDLTKLIKTKNAINTNTTNPNQIEDSENTSDSQTPHSTDIDPTMSSSKQIKLETIAITEDSTNYDHELHSELIIDEKISVDHEPNDQCPSVQIPPPSSQSIETAQDFIIRTTREEQSHSTYTPGQKLVANALREGLLQLKDNRTITTHPVTDQPTGTTSGSQHTEITVTAPPLLKLRPIEQLLAAIDVVEGTPAQPFHYGENLQQSVLEQVDQTIDKLTKFVNQPPDNNFPLLNNAVYQSQVEAEMRRRTVCLAEQALQFDELVSINFLRKFEHLKPDIMASYRIVQEVLINHKNPITHTERTQYNHYKGFMFQKQLESKLVQIEERKIMIDTPVPEYSDRTPIMHLTDTPCPHCKVGHKTGSTACSPAKLLTNMTKEKLRTNHTWRDKTKAVVISNKALVDLPIVLDEDVINIRVPRTLTYWVTPGHTGQADKDSKLYKEIMEILQLIGTESTYLVFIEFMKSHSNKTALEYQHLAFVRTCRELQTNYGGVIIPVIGLHRPTKGETTAKYLENKYQFTTCYGGAFAAGRWLGIPVDLPNIQNGAAHRESQRKGAPSWRNEPLFNIDAEPTREWYRRITIYLMSRISCFQPYYPMTDKHSRRIKLATPSYTASSAVLP